MSLPSGLPIEVMDAEPLARFIRQRSLYKPSTLQAKGDLFMPPRGATMLSVSRVGNLSNGAINELGTRVVQQAGNTLKGWCILETGRVRAIRNFRVESDEPDDQHFFHAHITGFPTDKSELMEAADDLAELAGPVVLAEV
ncbi:MAG: hypothetical protein JST38_07965 [Bacteroidetes bacterium]|nr:hypothetical protein [Bacteroidota bacterium]MBS1940796.1 hypothetical protein [Bacteroidota bacterium]